MSIVGYTTLRLTRVFPSFGALCFDLAGGFFDGDFFRAAHRAWSEPLSCSIHSASSFLLSSPPKPSEAEPYPVPRSLLVPRLSSKRGVGLSYAVHGPQWVELQRGQIRRGHFGTENIYP